MTSFNLETQTLLINSAADFPFKWYMRSSEGKDMLIETDDVFTAGTKTQVSEGSTYSPDPDGIMADPDGAGAGTAIVIADVDALYIEGFKWYRRTNVTKVIKSNGIAGQKQISTLGIAVSSPDAGSQIVVNIIFRSWDEKGEFATHNSDFKTLYSPVIDIAAGETAATLAAKIAKQFSEQGTKELRYFPLVVTVSSSTVTFTAKDEFTAFDITLEGATDTILGTTAVNQITTGKVTPTVTVTQVNFPGRNNYAQLRQYRPETNETVYPLAVGPDTRQRVSRNDLYACFIIEESVPDPVGMHHAFGQIGSRQIKSRIYVNTTTASALVTQLVNYFNSISGATKINMPATTAAAALATETKGTTLV